METKVYFEKEMFFSNPSVQWSLHPLHFPRLRGTETL